METALEVEPAAVPARGGFDDLFRAHYAPLVGSLTVLCGNRDVAADAAQEAFARAHVRWARVSRYEQPAAWVRRVAVNLVRDHYRRERRWSKVRDRLAGRRAETAAAPAEPSDLAGLLATLPEQQRTAVSLYYVGELSVAEVAETMGISEGAVKYHLHQGRQRLRPLLGDDEERGR